MQQQRRQRVIVVAALLEREGRVLIAQRKGGRHALKWEFPGGKVEPRESPRDALARELQEELAIQARIGPEITRYEHRYPRGPTLLLIFFRVESFTGEPRNAVFQQIKWELPRRLPHYDFLDGDADFVRRLARGRIRVSPSASPEPGV